MTRTRHGHHIPNTTTADENEPANVARCGGPRLCKQCRADIDPCPTCSGPRRETVDMVCQTCGKDFIEEYI